MTLEYREIRRFNISTFFNRRHCRGFLSSLITARVISSAKNSNSEGNSYRDSNNDSDSESNSNSDIDDNDDDDDDDGDDDVIRYLHTRDNVHVCRQYFSKN